MKKNLKIGLCLAPAYRCISRSNAIVWRGASGEPSIALVTHPASREAAVGDALCLGHFLQSFVCDQKGNKSRRRT